MQVLIVEDDDGIRETLKLTLESFGVAYLEANCMECALKVLAENKPTHILLDMLLKGDMGSPIISFARERYADNPPIIVMMTALHGADKLAEQYKVEHLVRKPFTVDDLMATLH